ncbi:MAG: iron uptake transporter permease EfeU [Candidatus Limnocylindria bacterium]
MDLGALTSGLLTGLREGVEAALIVGIILAYLAKTGNGRHFPKIWLGAGGAVAVSLALGVVLFMTLGELEEPYEQIFEGIAMLLAASVVTWMLFWMRRQAATVRSDLHERVDRVLTEGTAWGLTVLAFTAVIREGVETALFLLGQVTASAERGDLGSLSVLVGALVGLLAAVALGYALYRGSRRVNVRTFFRWTGIALIFIAGGLLSHAIHEFIEVDVITVGTETAFDISGVLPHEPDESMIGAFLRALLGYSSQPEIATLFVHVAYVVVVLWIYLRPIRPTPAPRRSGPEVAGA